MTPQDKLRKLAQLTRLRADKAGTRLARIQALIRTLETQSEALRAAPSTNPKHVGDAALHDRWARWRAQELNMLNTQIARLHAAAQPEREEQARETARDAVLSKLAKKSRR